MPCGHFFPLSVKKKPDACPKDLCPVSALALQEASSFRSRLFCGPHDRPLPAPASLGASQVPRLSGASVCRSRSQSRQLFSGPELFQNRLLTRGELCGTVPLVGSVFLSPQAFCRTSGEEVVWPSVRPFRPFLMSPPKVFAHGTTSLAAGTVCLFCPQGLRVLSLSSRGRSRQLQLSFLLLPALCPWPLLRRLLHLPCKRGQGLQPVPLSPQKGKLRKGRAALPGHCAGDAKDRRSVFLTAPDSARQHRTGLPSLSGKPRACHKKLQACVPLSSVLLIFQSMRGAV